MSQKGFTLIELLVVVLIVGILAAIALPQYQKSIVRARANQLLMRFNALEKGVQLYFLTYGEFPLDVRKLEPDLSSQGEYKHFSRWTRHTNVKAFEYPNGDQCGVYYSPDHNWNIMACMNDDIAFSVYYVPSQFLSKPQRACEGSPNFGAPICKQLSTSKKVIYTSPAGWLQYSLD